MFISFRYRKIRFHRCQYLSFCELSQTIDLYIELVTYINNRKTSTPRLFKIINQTNVIYQTIGQFFMSKIKRSERLMSINTFDKTWIVWNAAPEFIWISSIDPPTPSPIYFFPSTCVTREALYCDFIEFR